MSDLGLCYKAIILPLSGGVLPLLAVLRGTISCSLTRQCLLINIDVHKNNSHYCNGHHDTSIPTPNTLINNYLFT